MERVQLHHLLRQELDETALTALTAATAAIPPAEAPSSEVITTDQATVRAPARWQTHMTEARTGGAPVKGVGVSLELLHIPIQHNAHTKLLQTMTTTIIPRAMTVVEPSVAAAMVPILRAVNTKSRLGQSCAACS